MNALLIAVYGEMLSTGNADVRMTRNDDLLVVAGALHWARTVQAFLALTACSATGLWFAAWQAHWLGAAPAADFVALLGCVGSGWLTAHFIALFRLRSSIETAPVYRMLKDQPERVAWIFPKPVYLRLGGRRIQLECVMMLLTREGDVYRLPGVATRSLSEIEAALRRLAPEADFGLSEENRQRYQHTTGLVVR